MHVGAPEEEWGGVISAISVCANREPVCSFPPPPHTPAHLRSPVLPLQNTESWHIVNASLTHIFVNLGTNVTSVGHSAEGFLWVGGERVFSCMNLRFSTLKAFVNGAGSH